MDRLNTESGKLPLLDVATASVFPASSPPAITGRQRLALVPDVRNWAFDHIARNMTRPLSDGCDVEVFYLRDYKDYPQLYLDLFMGEHPFDLIHFFWRESLTALFDPANLHRVVQGLPPDQQDQFLWNVARTTKTTSVYDHLFLGPDEKETAQRRSLALADAYTVSSPRLEKIYQAQWPLPPPAFMLPDAVDLTRFKPGPLGRQGRPGQDVHVGWTGNSAWGEPGRDHKGLKTIFRPALERLQREGHPVRSVVQDRQETWISQEHMPEFYDALDVYVCASLSEGTPNPVLEAMACGLPVLSTDVGIVRSAFGPLQREFLVQDRQSPEFYEKLRRLVTDPDLRRRLSEENLESIKAWSWKQRGSQWLAFFSRAQEARAASSATTTQMALLTKLLATGERSQQAEIGIKQQRVQLAQLSAEVARQREILQRPTFRWLAKLSHPLSAWLHGGSRRG
jgi:glycosyltransferase involved in cell wall biosynthesis